MAKICNYDTLTEIRTIFMMETSKESQFHLITHMMNRTNEFDDIWTLLIKLKQGFFELD
jgi:hypothetical protein